MHRDNLKHRCHNRGNDKILLKENLKEKGCKSVCGGFIFLRTWRSRWLCEHSIEHSGSIQCANIRGLDDKKGSALRLSVFIVTRCKAPY